MTPTRRLTALALAAPLTLAIAACDDEAEGTVEGETIAPIPAPEGETWTDVITVSDADGFVMGNPDAPLKLIEYASHTCGGCANFAATGKPGLQEYVASGTLSFEQRNLVRDPIDLAIATLVRCGPDQNVQVLSDQAWDNLEETFASVQQNSSQYEAAGELPVDQRFIQIAQAAGLIDFFAARGLSADQQRQCLSDTAMIEQIANNSSEQAEELGINATPTFILNDRVLDVNAWSDLEPVLQRAGATKG